MKTNTYQGYPKQFPQTRNLSHLNTYIGSKKPVLFNLVLTIEVKGIFFIVFIFLNEFHLSSIRFYYVFRTLSVGSINYLDWT
jgi:hypothetical protein